MTSPPPLSSSSGAGAGAGGGATPSGGAGGPDGDDLDPSDDEIIAQRNIVQSLQKMSVNPSSMRYHGKSSSLLFIQAAMDLKHEYAGVEMPKTIDPDAHVTLLKKRQQYWSLHPVRPRPCSASLMRPRTGRRS